MNNRIKWIEYPHENPLVEDISTIYAEALIKLPHWLENEGSIRAPKGHIRVIITKTSSWNPDCFKATFWAFNRGVELVSGESRGADNYYNVKEWAEDRLRELFNLTKQ